MSKINPEFYAPYDYNRQVPRARHNLSTKISTTMHIGVNVPVYHRRMYRGDDFDINNSSLIQTIVPFVRPLLDCFELRFETYWCPLSNYYGWMDNNSKETTEDIVTKSPKWTVRLFGYDSSSDVSTGLIDIESMTVTNGIFNPSESYGLPQEGSLSQYFGVPPYWQGNPNGWDGESYSAAEGDVNGALGNDINAEPFLCYLDIMRSYHINNQYGSIPVYLADSYGTLRYGYPFSEMDSYSNLDDLFAYLRYKSSHRDADLLLDDYSVYNTPLKHLWNWVRYCLPKNSGFFPVQHRPDLWRNLLSNTAGSVQAKVEVVNGAITINEFREQNKFQKWIDSLDASSGRYGNILSNVFGKKGRVKKKMPYLLGVTRHLIDPSNITAMAESGDYSVGEKASNIDKFNTGGKVRVKADEDGYVMIICNITPLVTYSQGFSDNALRLSFNDDFNPFFQRLGYQSVPRIKYSAYPKVNSGYTDFGTSFDESIGKSIKWIDEMTDVNHSYADFTAIFGQYSDMVLNRIYNPIEFDESDNSLQNSTFILSPYVNPLDYNDIFALDSFVQNPFSVHIALNISAKRPILKRWTPSLE